MKKYRCKIYLTALFCFVSFSGWAQEDSLAIYMLSAVRDNPAVIAEYHSYKSLAIACIGSGQLNDPEVNIGVFPKAMQHADSKQILTVSVMQMFPWFGTLKAGRQMQEWKAEAAYQKFREDGIALVYDVQQQWYDILATQEQIKSVQRNLKILKDIEKTALYQYKTAYGAKNARLSDQLRLQAEEARLDEQIESLQDKEKLQRQQFNLLMHRSADSSLSFPDTMKLREMPIVDWPQLERDNPRLQQLLAQGKMYDAQADMVKGQGRPMIGIGLEYMLNGRVDMPVMPSMNGMDMLMPMLKVTLPIYRKKTEAGIKSARLMKESTVFDYQRQQDMLRSQYLSIEQQATDAKREILLYNKEMNLLDRTLQLMMTEYANGTTSLTDILQTSRENIDYALKQFETQAKYNILVAEYEKLASKYDYVQK